MPHVVLPNDKSIIAVCGATGFQGGSVVKHLLRDNTFAPRALTRSANSAGAQNLAKAGVSVVEANFDGLSSLCEAFKGCYGVYAVTDYFEALDKEKQHGLNIIDAAKVAGVKHIVFSATEDVPYDAPHMKHKAAAVAYLKNSGVPFTALYLTSYYSNMFLLDAFQSNPDGSGVIMKCPIPTDVPIPSISPKDVGAYALAAFVNPQEWVGKDMRVCNEYLTPRDYAEGYAKVTGSPVEVVETTRAEFFALENEPFVLNLWGVIKWFIELQEGKYPKLSPELAKRLCPDRQTWQDYLAEHLKTTPAQPASIKRLRARELAAEQI